MRTAALSIQRCSVGTVSHSHQKRLHVTSSALQRHVAVIGAGAAGLVTAKELRAAGHIVQVYEKTGDVGGVWKYTDRVDSDLLGQDAQRQQVHSSMYRHLRTNLPREVMGFMDYPFLPEMMGSFSRDPRRFCSHEEVQAYLEAFTAHFNLKPLVRFNTEVLSITPRSALPPPLAPSTTSSTNSPSSAPPPSPATLEPGCASVQGTSTGPSATPSGTALASAASTSSSSTEDRPPTGWRLHGRTAAGSGVGSAVGDASGEFWQDVDAVVVCNGHYSQPQLPQVEGMGSFPGHQMHSHNYRDNSRYKGQVVLIVGASNSGEDISREVSEVACRVLLSARSWQRPDLASDPTPYGPRRNIYRRPMVTRLRPDGGAVFEDGRVEERVDAVIYCTGYQYAFPFLQHTELVSTEGGHVRPLYQHMFPPTAGASLTFIGLPWKVVPFPLFQLQAQFLGRVLAGEAALPPPEAMQASAEAFYKDLRERGIAERYTHRMSEEQWEYCEWLAGSGGPAAPRLEGWREAMYVATGLLKRAHQEGYRDGAWPDPGMLEVVGRDLAGLVAAAKAEGVEVAAVR